MLKTLSIGKAAAYTIANWERLTRFSPTRSFRSTTTRPSAGFAGQSSAARITTDQSHAAAPRSQPSSTRSSRPRSSTTSIRPSTCSKPYALPTATSSCSPGSSPQPQLSRPSRRGLASRYALLYDLFGAPAGSIGPFFGITFMGLEWKATRSLYVIFDPTSIAVPVPQVSGAPFGYPQYRFTIGLQLGA